MPDDDDAESAETTGSPERGDAAWELPEWAAAWLVVVVGLFIVGSAAGAVMFEWNQGTPPGSAVWSGLIIALRWLDPSVILLLLVAAAIVWWQFDRWVSASESGTDAAVVGAHVERLRRIAGWSCAAFVATMASAVVLIVAEVKDNLSSGDTIQSWGIAMEDLSWAVGSALLAGLGFVAMRRILVASRGGDASPDS